jgi:hypothetical protein
MKSVAALTKETGTHKPLVAGSNPAAATIVLVRFQVLLRGLC